MHRFPTSSLARGAALVALLSLGACGNGDAPAEPTADLDRMPDTSAPPTAAEPSTPGTLPASLLGTFDTNADQCAEPGTMTRLTVARDTIQFYYGYAIVDGVTAHDGDYDIDATLYQQEGAIEVEPDDVTYQVSEADGGILFEVTETDLAPSVLVRCEAQ